MSLFTRSTKSHRRHSITISSVKSMLKAQGFNVANKDAIRHEIKRLDVEVIDLIYDDNAYWANRQACWNLTSLLIGEVK